MIVDLFIPCYVDQLYPDTAMNMVKVLERVGCGVNYNHEQTCCGQPAFHAGYWDHCKEVGEKFIKEFQTDRYIVSPSSSCPGFVRNHYSEMFQNSVLHNQFRQVQKNMFEFTDFLVNVLKITDLGARMNGVGVFHDACSGLREYGIHREPRLLLSKVRELEMKELPGAENCCGFGGMFSTRHEPIAVGMAEQKIQAIESTGAEYIIATDMSCLSHLEGYIKKQGKNIRIMHVADVLIQGWE
jgi:L-lactate dehydrogenase complex protein LldE